MKMQGVERVHARFALMERRVPDLLGDALLAAAEPIREEAQLRAPVSDRPGGHLRTGIRAALVNGLSSSRVAVRIGVKEKLWYGVFPEYGTSRMAARPFMRPAFDLKRREALRIFKEQIKRGVT